MSNVMSMKGIQNHVHRNGFDLSARNLFTAKVGELLPVMVREVLPGDKFKIKQQWFTRTVPVKSPAFVRIREYYDYFFVPNRVLWRQFGDFINPTKSPSYATSIDQSNTVDRTLPYTTFGSILKYLRGVRDINQNNANINIVSAERWLQSLKLLNYLGYGDFSQYVKKDKSTDDALFYNQTLNVLPIYAYQKIYQDFYRNSQWEQARPYLSNLDYLIGNIVTYVDFSRLGTYRHVDTALDLRYCDWQKDMFMGVLPSAQYGDVATVDPTGSGTLTASKFSLKTPQLVFNKASEGRASLIGHSSDSAGSTTKKRIYGVTAPTSSSSSDSALIYSQSLESGTTSPIALTLNDVDFSSAFSILALRQAEALQRRNEITQANRQDIVHQMKAHWNVDVPDALGNMCTYIGGHVGNVSINEVVNTSLTQGDTSDAFMNGKGVGSGDGSLTFEAKEHGILMCIYHAMPLLEWSSQGIKPLNCKCVDSDFAIPEFDSIGMQEVPAIYMANNPMVQEFLDKQKSLGYGPRYFDYKTAVDESHGAFMSSLSDWTANLTEEYMSYQLFDAAAIGSGIDYGFFKVNAAILTNIFGVNPWADGGSVDTDQLRINTFFDCKVVRNLDYNGLPY